MFMCNLLKYEKIKQGKFTCVAIKMENTKFDTVRGKIDTLTHTHMAALFFRLLQVI